MRFVPTFVPKPHSYARAPADKQLNGCPKSTGRRDWDRTNDPHHVKMVPQRAQALERISKSALNGDIRNPPVRCETLRFRPRAVNVTTRRDPALEKLLRELPAEDPDPHELAEVWLAFAERRAIVTIGVETAVKLGPWCGPAMPLADVVLHARKLSTGEESFGLFPRDEVLHVVMHAGMSVRLVVLVE